MFKARRDERIDSAFDLLDRMLPTEVLQLSQHVGEAVAPIRHATTSTQLLKGGAV